RRSERSVQGSGSGQGGASGRASAGGEGVQGGEGGRRGRGRRRTRKRSGQASACGKGAPAGEGAKDRRRARRSSHARRGALVDNGRSRPSRSSWLPPMRLRMRAVTDAAPKPSPACGGGLGGGRPARAVPGVDSGRQVLDRRHAAQPRRQALE